MAATAHLYEIFIKAPRQRVWDALIEEEYTTRYFHGTRFESTFEPGAPFVNRIVAADAPAVDGVIEEFDPPNRLAMTWHVLYDDEMAAEPAGRVEWTLVDANADGSVTRVTVRHGDLALSPKTWLHVKLGWVAILDGLKTLLETGEPMPAVDDEVTDVPDVEGQWHRSQGIAANNSVWELLDGRELTPEEGDELLARAYAASYHWARGGGAGADQRGPRRLHDREGAHRARPGRHGPALGRPLRRAARRGRDDAADFDHAYGHEARARALACAGRGRRSGRARPRGGVPGRGRRGPQDRRGRPRSGPWFGLS